MDTPQNEPLSREQVESLRTQLADERKRAEELDTLTTMQDGGIRGLHAQIRALTDKLAASEAESVSWRTVLHNEREAAQTQIAELRLRRQETINIAVQLECELEQLRGQLAEAQATIARYEAHVYLDRAL